MIRLICFLSLFISLILHSSLNVSSFILFQKLLLTFGWSHMFRIGFLLLFCILLLFLLSHSIHVVVVVVDVVCFVCCCYICSCCCLLPFVVVCYHSFLLLFSSLSTYTFAPTVFKHNLHIYYIIIVFLFQLLFFLMQFLLLLFFFIFLFSLLLFLIHTLAYFAYVWNDLQKSSCSFCYSCCCCCSFH